MRGVHVVLLSTTLLTLTGCATTSPLGWLADEHAMVISQDLATAVTERWPVTHDSIYVGDMPLRDHFEQAIRSHGYAVSIDPDNAIEISGLGERIPPNTWHIGLTVDENIQIHRLYRIHRDEVHALTSISVGDIPTDEDETELPLNPRWHLRPIELRGATHVTAIVPQAHSSETANVRNSNVAQRPAAIQGPMTQPRSTSVEPSAPAETPFPPTAPTPDAFDVSERSSADGAVFTFTIGSLKQSLVDALAQRGWTVTAWPNDTQNERLIVDWIVTRETSVNVSSVEDLLAGLRATFGLNATVDVRHREIAFSMGGDV